jgi:hypothetical protein
MLGMALPLTRGAMKAGVVVEAENVSDLQYRSRNREVT